MDRLDTGGQLNDGQCVGRKIEKARRTYHHQGNIVPRHTVDTDMALFGGIGKETQNYDASHKQSQTHLG